MKKYWGKISYLLPVLFLPAIFSVLALSDGELFRTPDFFILFWLVSLILVLIPLGYNLEIENDLITERFCGIKIKKFQPNNVESVTCGSVSLFERVNPFFGIPHGKGIVLLVNINGARKIYSFSEKLYGKKVIEDIKLMSKQALPDILNILNYALSEEDLFNIQKMREVRIKNKGEFFNSISEILFKHDPIGLDFETNIDEYDYEAKLIIEKIKEQNNLNELTELIYSVFVRAFDKDTAGSKKKYESIAEEIWSINQSESLLRE